MFTYLRMKQDFLRDLAIIREESQNSSCNNPSLIKEMKDEINYNQKVRPFSVKSGDMKSWHPSMELFEDIMCSLGDDVGIAFEYMMDYRSDDHNSQDLNGYNKRVDVMIGGRDKDGQYVLFIIEMKQWGGDSISYNPTIDGITSYRNPSKQVVEYCTQLATDNEKVRDGSIVIIPIVWLPKFDLNSEIIRNLDIDKIKNELEHRYFYSSPNGKYIEPRVFYGDQKESIRELLNDYFGQKKDIFSEFRKGFSLLSLHNDVADILNGNIIVKLRSDQKNCLDEIKKRFYNGERGFIYVKGRAGSGKSIVCVELLREAIKKGIATKYLMPETAPCNAYKDELDKETKKYFNTFQYLTSDELTELVIVDEGHNMHEKDIRILNEYKNALKIVFFDPKQKTSANCVFNENNDIKPDYELISQFRCNMDDGYLRFVDDILDNKTAEDCFTAEYLDFDVKLIKESENLLKLCRDDKYVILTGPKYAQKKKNIQLKSGIINQWPVDYNGVFLNSRNQRNDNLYSGVNSIRGLETKHIIVFIGDGDGDLQYDKDFKIIKGSDCVKNMYRVLLTRATDSCYIYCENQNLRDYLYLNKHIQFI